MTGVFAIIGASIAAVIVSVLIGIGLRYVTQNNIIHAAKTFLTTGAVGAHVAGVGTVGFWAIFFAPIWLVIAGILLAVLIGYPMMKAGYLGNQYQWRIQMQDDETVQAALNLLDDHEVESAAQVSSSAEDFRENLIESAGLDGHENPGLD